MKKTTYIMPNCDKRRKLLGSPLNVFKHSKFRKNCKKALKSLKKRKKSFVSLQLFAMAPLPLAWRFILFHCAF